MLFVRVDRERMNFAGQMLKALLGFVELQSEV